MHNRDTKYLNSAIMIKVNFRRSHSVETMRCLVQGGGREGGGRRQLGKDLLSNTSS